MGEKEQERKAAWGENTDGSMSHLPNNNRAVVLSIWSAKTGHQDYFARDL